MGGLLNKQKTRKLEDKLQVLFLAFACSFCLSALIPAVAGVQAPGQQAQSQQVVDLNSYLKHMGHIFSSSWTGAQPAKSTTATVEFTLHANGAVSDARISKSSGSDLIDKEAVETVNKASLPPLPTGTAPEMDVNFTFRLNVFE